MKTMTMVIVISVLLAGVLGTHFVSYAQDSSNTEETGQQTTAGDDTERNRINTPDEGDTSGKSNYGIFEDESKENSN